jgi:PAS domain S-box-containing protein
MSSKMTKFEGLLEAVPDALVGVDHAGVIRFVNRQTEMLFGYDCGDLIGAPVEILVPESLRPAHEVHREGYIVTPFTRTMGQDLELRGRRRDGTQFPVDVALSHTDTEEGPLVIAAVRDLTGGKSGEVHQQSERLAAIVEHSEDAIIGKTLDGIITSWNRAAEQMYGYSADEIIGKSIEQLCPAARAGEIVSILAQVRAGHTVEHFETIRVRKDGTVFPVLLSVTPIHDEHGAVIGASTIARDQTQQEETFDAARSMIESSMDALVAISAAGTITDVNGATVKVTGVPRAELIGTTFSDYFTDPDKANQGYQLVFDQGSVTDYPLTLRHRDGALTEVSYNASVYRDAAGNVLGVFAAARDVTDRRRIERTLQEKNVELEHANVELEHASRMKSEFLATMSHELRTPLNSVIGFSEALKDGLLGELTGSQQEYIGDIFTSGQHLLSLINDILDLSKVEAGMMSVELEEADVRQLLSDALSIVREKASARSIRLDLELDEGLGLAELDVRKTKQIVYNLLSNAVKFSSAGGLVSLRAQVVGRSAVGVLEGPWPVRSFALADNEFTQFLQICVTDGGIGISAADMAKLFQAFTQIDSTLARMFEGTGLGLATVKQMSELLGGTVAVTSKEGEGACFAVWVPLRAPTPPALGGWGQLQARAVVDPQVHERVALVVEDEDNAADLVRILLEAEGFAVLRAPSAEEALQIAPQQDLDLITLDIALPGIDGWEFLAGIRADATLGKVPVVVISATSSGPPVALAGGAAAVLQKPVSRAALKEALGGLGFDDTADQTRTVLVVDDDPKAVEVIAASLPAPAYATVRAYGVQEAIVLAHRMRPDLILLALMMPKVSGFDVVHKLGSDPATAGIPILVITAKHVTATDRQALNSDPDHAIHIIEKSGFNRADFMAEVRRALP